ncbi:ras-related protein Rab-44 [Gracilinanus agilis]|uniref:ras-related protein Rab-44 n=1 Tax=Gracilinanus agilis TaxID=191870 RepID=UPI001CFD74B7|nr:ras-related protein Rab-44 [Gracilinanus agilis]
MEGSSRIGRKSRKLGSRRRYQMREAVDEDAPSVPDAEHLPSQATEELQDFFRECGAEHKGFVTREDLGRAKFSFLGSPEELELIFDWMDLDRKGRLTLKEFTSGLKNVFSSQTKIPGPRKRKTRTWIFSKEESTSLQPLEEADPEERRWFLSFMEQLGADHLFLDQAEIWQLWKKLRQEEPHLVGNLEGFLAKVTSRLQETRAEKEALQMTLKKCDDDHHREVRQLYEELEQQIHSEKERLQAASNTQGLAYSSMMHQALEAKEQEVQHLAKGQRELEAHIDLLRSKRQEVSIENQRLQETQKDLTGQLEQVRGQLQVTRGHLNQAKGQVSWQVEEETSLASDLPVDPKNTSGSQHLDLFPEEDPLPLLFEEGDWSQLLKNFTSPLPGNNTQVSWSPPPTPTSLQGHHTPRVVRQISITNSWGLKQESPSDPEVLPRSPPEPSTDPAIVPELSVADEIEMEDASGQEAEILHTSDLETGDVLGQRVRPSGSDVSEVAKEAGLMESSVTDMANSPGWEDKFMRSPETDVVMAAIQESGLIDIESELHVGNIHGQEVGFSKSPGPDGNGTFLYSPGSDVGDTLTLEAKLIESPRMDRDDATIQSPGVTDLPNIVGDASDQETSPGSERLMDVSGPVVANFYDEGVQLIELPGPNVGDVLEEKPGNIESSRPDVLPVIPEHGVLQDQSPDEVQRAEDRGLQSQAQEGSLFPKDASGNTPGPEHSGPGLSIMVEAGAQAGSEVLGSQITAPYLEPTEEKKSGVAEETNLKVKAKRATATPEEGSPDPDYLFHVLFLGDSNVGKTTFLYLLHHNSFATGLAATVGMDYQIKNLVVDNRRFALQLWDTAGQERYHSITRQFLRKADGIVLMYDVTCPESFLHVRYWLDCIQEAGVDDVAILLLGNKTDCVEERQVSTETGQLLAKEIGVAFGECSAALGHNILGPIVTLARAMQEQDSRLRYNTVDLEKKEVKKKAGCCS